LYTYTSPDNKYRNAKYILPFVIGFFFLLSAGQIIGQFVTVDQLNKASGNIEDLNTKIRSYSKQSSGHKPNYALTIVLNGNSYDMKIQLPEQSLVGYYMLAIRSRFIIQAHFIKYYAPALYIRLARLS